MYRPSLLARVAKFFLHRLEGILPFRLYEFVYQAVYVVYKKTWRGFYFASFLKEKYFGDVHEAAKASLTFMLLPYTMGGRKALENAFHVTALVDKKKIEGAIVECGVAEGGTAAMMALTNRELGVMKRTTWLFDSYEGLPEPTQEDYQGGEAGYFIRPLRKGACLGTIEQVQNLVFDKLKFSSDEVRLVKGWFQETVPIHREKMGPIAVLRLDGDWYESTRIPLENFFDQVVPGGYVIIDDYSFCFGARKATDEFRTSRHITSPLYPDGRGGAWFEKE